VPTEASQWSADEVAHLSPGSAVSLPGRITQVSGDQAQSVRSGRDGLVDARRSAGASRHPQRSGYACSA